MIRIKLNVYEGKTLRYIPIPKGIKSKKENIVRKLYALFSPIRTGNVFNFSFLSLIISLISKREVDRNILRKIKIKSKITAIDIGLE